MLQLCEGKLQCTTSSCKFDGSRPKRTLSMACKGLTTLPWVLWQWENRFTLSLACCYVPHYTGSNLSNLHFFYEVPCVGRVCRWSCQEHWTRTDDCPGRYGPWGGRPDSLEVSWTAWASAASPPTLTTPPLAGLGWLRSFLSTVQSSWIALVSIPLPSAPHEATLTAVLA